MKRYFIGLFLICFIVYNLNFSLFSGRSIVDTAPNRILPFAMLSGSGIYLDAYYPLFRLQFDNMDFLRKFQGNFISAYPIFPGILALPFYAPVFLYLIFSQQATSLSLYEWSLSLEKVSASFFAAISVALFFLLMKKLSKKTKTSFIFAFIFAFCTQTFSISSQYLWQHGIANLFFILSLLFFIKGLEESGKRKTYFILSLLIAQFSLYSRITFFFNSFLLLVFTIYQDRKNKNVYLSIFLGGLLLLLGYNFYFFQSFFGGTHNYFDFSRILQSFFGIMFSPSRGIVFYSSLIFFVLIVPLFCRRIIEIGKKNVLFLLNFLYIILALVLNLLWGNYWWGGWSFGSRLLTDVAVSTVIISYFIYISNKNFIFRLIFFAVIFYSLIVQIVGVFFYPRGHFDDFPTNIDLDTGRLWNMQDNLFTRNIAVGPELLGFYRFYYTVKGIQSKKYNYQERKCSLKILKQDSFLGFNRVNMYFRNESNVDWVTGGNNILNIRQIFLKNREIITESPIPTELPPILKSRQGLQVSAIIVKPIQDFDAILLAPVQENVSWWTAYCSVEISAKN